MTGRLGLADPDQEFREFLSLVGQVLRQRGVEGWELEQFFVGDEADWDGVCDYLAARQPLTHVEHRPS